MRLSIYFLNLIHKFTIIFRGVSMLSEIFSEERSEHKSPGSEQRLISDPGSIFA